MEYDEDESAARAAKIVIWVSRFIEPLQRSGLNQSNENGLEISQAIAMNRFY